MKHIAVILASLASIILAGCAFAPGMRFNADSATPAQTQDGTSVDVNGQHYVLRPLTVAGVNAVTAAPVRPVVDEPAEDVMQSGIGYQYKVGVGDVLHVIVWDHPELNNPGIGAQSGSAIQTGSAQTLAAQAVASSNGGDALGRVVQADGTIYYPYIGTLRVKGKTVPEIRAALTTGIARYVRAPQLDVSVVSFRSQKVYVTGEVKQPEVVPLTDVPVNVADAIGLAGGVTPEADLSGATLTRGKKQISIDLYRLLYLGDMRNNIRLVDGDIVDIPNRRIKKVFVMGEIAKPASLPMPTDGPYTLAEALNDAGGLNPLTSNARQLYLVRASGLNTTTVFHLDCSSPVAVALADQVVLSPRDIIYVDAASVTRFSRVISQMLPFAGGLADLKSLGM